MIFKSVIIISFFWLVGLSWSCLYLLGFHLVELVDLFAHLGDGIVVLLADVGQGRLVLDVGLFQVAAEFRQFRFALLVQFDLSGGGTAGFLQSLAELLEFAGQIGALLLGLQQQQHSGHHLMSD